ncbi:MAG TPA: S8 family serine peptidase [Solirubrobacteraceae bacterium]|jgi:serine protease
MSRRLSLPILAVLASALLPAAPSLAAEMVPGQVVVKREGAEPRVKRVQDVDKALDALRGADSVEYAAPNPVAHAAATAFVPNDPGRGRGWQAVQWNFLAGFGVNAPVAWQHAIDAGAPGGRGVTIAVLDTGAAYADRGRFRQSPDLAWTRFVHGYDFIDDDPYPHDENGHGTHVTSTIAESTNNRLGLTGLAYGASILPVRVLDANGEGDAATIAEAIRWSVKRGAQLINLSIEFDTDVGAKEIPSLLEALAFARRRGVLVVGATGNAGDTIIAFPARSTNVLAVGATTEHGCLSEYSNLGRGIDLVAPGGGGDAFEDDAGCRPEDGPGRSIVQLTFEGDSLKRFGMPTSYEGTSMAVPHVTATLALVLATRVLGPDPSPEKLIAHLKATARDLGPAGVDTRYGAGLIDAAAATDKKSPAAVRLRGR